MFYSLLSNVDALTDGRGLSSFDSIDRFFSSFLIFIFVLILAYFTTKFLAGSRLQRLNSNNIKVLESVSLGHQSVIQLIQIGHDRYILVAVTKDKVTFLSDVDKESINLEASSDNLSMLPFEKYLKNFMKRNSDGQEDDDI